MCPNVVYVSVDKMCYQVSPCYHDVTIFYDDNTEKIKNMLCYDILDKYEKYLSEEEIKHLRDDHLISREMYYKLKAQNELRCCSLQ